MATIEGLLVLSSLRRGVNASKDHTSSPSIGVIITLLFSNSIMIMTTWIITIRRPPKILYLKWKKKRNRKEKKRRKEKENHCMKIIMSI